MDDTAAQAKAIDASITAAFYNGMEKAAVLVCLMPDWPLTAQAAAAAIRAGAKELRDG